MKYKFVIAFSAIALIFFRYLSTKPNFPDGQKIRINSVVRAEPLRYQNSQALNLEGLKVYLPPYPEVNYGDSVVVEGTVNNDKLSNPKLVKVTINNGLVYGFRKKLLSVYEKSLPMDHAALVAGIVLGSKENITQSFWQQLKASGTAHVVVASGMNVSLIASFLINFLVVFISRRKALVVAIAGIWFYTLLSGFDSPVVRAAIMGSLTFSAQKLGKLSDAFRSLLIAAFLMLLYKPIWVQDVGFWLSFAATLALIFLEKRVRNFVKWLPEAIKENFSTTVAAQIGVAPIMMFAFGKINIFSPVINTLVLWTIVPITLIGIIGGLVGLIIEPLGKLILLLAYPLTFWFITLVKLFS